jgi:hypothetical protein
MSAALKDRAEVTPAQIKQNVQQTQKAFNEKHGIRPLTPTEKSSYRRRSRCNRSRNSWWRLLS